MKKYRALSTAVFKIADVQYCTKVGDIIELPEEHVTTRALVERRRLEELSDENVPETPENVTERPLPKVKTPKK